MSNEIDNLLKLIKENPDLKIIPMVHYDCVEDGGGYWSARWGEASVDEYYEDDGRIYFKNNDFEDVVNKFYEDGYGTYEDDITEEEAEKLVNEVDWVKCIVVYIEPA
jgi:hypothetical protein